MPIPTIDRIETRDWVKDNDGRYHDAGPRLVSAVAGELTQALERAPGLSGLEYVSTRGYNAGPTTRWPEGEVFVALQVGGNEGYSLSVYVVLAREQDKTAAARVVQVIRAKLLSTHDDALAYHALAFHLLGA